MGIGGGGDGFPNLSKAIFLRTTTIRVDLQVFTAAAAAAQSQSVVADVVVVVEAVYMENAKARCDVVFMIWFYPSLEIEDPFKGFL